MNAPSERRAVVMGMVRLAKGLLMGVGLFLGAVLGWTGFAACVRVAMRPAELPGNVRGEP